MAGESIWCMSESPSRGPCLLVKDQVLSHVQSGEKPSAGNYFSLSS